MLIALLAEGQTERIYFEYLLPAIQLPDKLLVSRRIDRIMSDPIERNKIWLVDCQGDGAIARYINKNDNTFMGINFDRLIFVRDYFPENRPPTSLCKADVCQSILGRIRPDIYERYQNNIYVNISVEEVEAWFFADKQMFARVNPLLTEAYINQEFDNILDTNPEHIKRPYRRLEEIIRMVSPDYIYDKHEDAVHSIVSKISMDKCFDVMSTTYVQSFNRIVTYLFNTL